MKTMIKLLAVLAIAMATFSQHTTASAGSVFHFKGKGADAFFSTIDSSGCIFTDVFVFASEEIFQNPPGPRSASSGTFLFISQYDTCTNTLLLSADGFTSLGDPDFQATRKLNSATLIATVNVHDGVSDSFFDVFVDLAWTGTGPLNRQNGRFHFHSPGCTQNSHFNSTFRPAEASGSVSDGATNFTPDTSLGAGIFSAKNGDVVVGCN